MVVQHVGFNISIFKTLHPVPSKSKPTLYSASLSEVLKDDKGEFKKYLGSVYGDTEKEALRLSIKIFEELIEKAISTEV